MKKFVIYGGVATLALNALTARADDGLLPTNVLGTGQAAVYFNVDGYVANNAITLPLVGLSGTQSVREVSEYSEFRLGVGHDLEVRIGVPSNSSYNLNTDFTDGQSFTSHPYRGWQNPVFTLKYGILTGRNTPAAISAQISVAPDTSNVVSTLYTGVLTGAWNFGGGLKAWAQYTGNFYTGSTDASNNNLALGLQKSVGSKVTLLTEAFYGLDNETKFDSRYRNYGLSAALRFQITPSTSLIPSIGLEHVTAISRNDGVVDWGTINGKSIALGFYHQF